MSGLLLTAGPISTVDSVKKSSRIFLFSISKSKFETAASRLQALDLGTLKHLSGKHRHSAVFVKRLPSDVEPILVLDECQDLCTIEEYTERFERRPPGSITPSLQNIAIAAGWVSPELFKD